MTALSADFCQTCGCRLSFRHAKDLPAVLPTTILNRFSETSGMMPNFVGIEKVFAHVTFKASDAAGHSFRKQFSTRQILNGKLPEPGGGSTVEQSDYED